MPTKKRTSARKRATPKTTRRARKGASTLRERWEATVASLAAAQAEMERQVKKLLSQNKLGSEAAQAFRELRARFEQERKKAVRELESRMAGVQARVQKERQNLGRVVDEGVRSALVALNIPSRTEVAELTRKVDDLSRKIDSFRPGSAARQRSTGKPASA